MERCEQLSWQLSESEFSLEMDKERQLNERAYFAGSPTDLDKTGFSFLSERSFITGKVLITLEG